jgi:hypothetical protein
VSTTIGHRWLLRGGSLTVDQPACTIVCLPPRAKTAGTMSVERAAEGWRELLDPNGSDGLCCIALYGQRKPMPAI